MDTRDGTIHDIRAVKMMAPADLAYILEMQYHPTPQQWKKRKIGRDELCPCGSGRKFKKCCLGKIIRQ